MSEFFKWLSGRQKIQSIQDFETVEKYDKNKEQLLCGWERDEILQNKDRGDGPPMLSCINDSHCNYLNSNLVCRRIPSENGGGKRVAVDKDGKRVIYMEVNGFENECVSSREHSYVADPIYGRPADPHECGGGRRKRSYTKKKSKGKVSKHKKSKNRSKQARKTRRKKRRKTKKKNTFN